MSKKIFVLLIALIFFSSIIYFISKYIKIAQIQRENESIELKEDVLNKEENMENDEEKEENEQINYNNEQIIGILQIQKIGLNAKVKEGSSEEILENYIGHIEETSKFYGNVGLAAHNRGAKNNYFENLDKLSIGDKIAYKTSDGRKNYKVYRISEILDTDWSKFENTQENKLTLITCVKNKINVRLCVQAREV